MIYGKDEKGRSYKCGTVKDLNISEEEKIEILRVLRPTHKFSTKIEELEEPKKQIKKDEKPQESKKQKLLKGVFYSQFDNDILKIQVACADKGFYFKDAKTVKQLWEDFSSKWHVGWIIITPNNIDEFIRYLETDDYKTLR